MYYLLSIVIPTKNRYETLIPLLEVISQYASNELELVIQDNSDNNSLFLKYLKGKENPNIKYKYTKEWLSVGENCDKAILSSSGEYVSFIGDDDAFAPQIIQIARIMKEKKVDSCNCDYVLYRWPTALGKNRNSYEYKTSFEITEFCDLKKKLKNTMSEGIQNKKGFPGVYHGIVRREILDKVFKTTGSFFPGPSPDMANAFSLALFIKKHINTSIPFIIDGYSKASTGHLTEEKKHVGMLEEQPFLPKDTVENWTKQLPQIWLPNTIWPESAIQALKRCGRTDMLKNINFNAVYIKISVMYPEYKSICRELSQKYSSNFNYLKTYLIIGIKYVCNKIRLGKVKGKFIKNEITIKEAIMKTSAIIDDNDMISRFKDSF